MANPIVDGGPGSSAGIAFGESSEMTRSAVYKPYGSNVVFEECLHYAVITRAGDRTAGLVHTDHVLTVSSLKALNLFAKKITQAVATKAEVNEKGTTSASPDRAEPFAIAEEEDFAELMTYVHDHDQQEKRLYKSAKESERESLH